ncbi:hypothetical protein ACQPW1_09925 [Nocardia sp. CA-128927]|uniref:hypothetical protein n=1 Tax=Nocardia sp. CA-128927 TaxID=3239975 RepID=UPI003D979759
MPFPTPYSPETRSTAMELLVQARDDGMNQNQAAIAVAGQFNNGPAVSTLHLWAKEAKLFAAPTIKKAKHQATRSPLQIHSVAVKATEPAHDHTSDPRDVASTLKQENQTLRVQVASQAKEIKALRGLVSLYV